MSDTMSGEEKAFFASTSRQRQIAFWKRSLHSVARKVEPRNEAEVSVLGILGNFEAAQRRSAESGEEVQVASQKASLSPNTGGLVTREQAQLGCDK